MNIIIKVIGKEKNIEFKKLFQQYLIRTKWTINIQEAEFNKNSSEQEHKEKEGEWLMSNIDHNSFIYVLDERGRQFSSQEFSQHLLDKIISYKKIYFIVGGAFGLSEEVRKKANVIMSLGKMTFPHKLVRLILSEQLYRAYTIYSKHPYHK